MYRSCDRRGAFSPKNSRFPAKRAVRTVSSAAHKCANRLAFSCVPRKLFSLSRLRGFEVQVRPREITNVCIVRRNLRHMPRLGAALIESGIASALFPTISLGITYTGQSRARACTNVNIRF